MADISFLGGCREVGRSAVQVLAGRDSFLMDYGLEVQYGQVPIKPARPISGVFITHAHIDHSGMGPQLYKEGYQGAVHATRATFSLMELLLHDSIKVQKKRGEEPHFLPHHVEALMKKGVRMEFRKPVKFKDSEVTLLDSGHIPGSSGVLIESKGKKILYTGDLKFMDTRLMKGASIDMKGLDALICESTYSYKDHPSRPELEDRLREIAQETIYGDGHLIIPSFAVGRTQELLIILQDLGFPLYLDGMGIDATEAILQNPSSMRDAKALDRAFGRAHKVFSSKDRKGVLDKPGIIICTAGMLNGGPVSYYIKKLHNQERCAMVMTGFQVPGTVGRVLMDTGRYVNEGIDVKPKFKIEFMDFSAHTDRSHLIDFFKRTNPKKLLLVHGDRTPEFAKEMKAMGFNAEAPKNGDKVKL